MQSRVIVVGAGLAGLAAARSLADEGCDVVVCEARDRVGGRVLNHRFDDGNIVEVGGQWVGTTQTYVFRLIGDLGLEVFDTYDTGHTIGRLGSGSQRFLDDQFPIPKAALAEVGLAQKRLEWMAARVPTDAPWNAKKASTWDAMTLESWLRRNLRLERAREFYRLVCAAVFAAEPSEVSLLHFLFYLHSGGMLDRLLNVVDGAQEQRVVGGTELIAAKLAGTLGDRVLLSSPVRAISQTADGVVVSTDEQTVTGDAVIVTTPPHLIAAIGFDPPLPARRRQLVQKMPMGAVIKCVAVYPTPFWRDNGLSGAGVSTEDPVSVVFDNSPPDANVGMLVGFFEGEAARVASALSPHARRRVVVDTFVAMFGSRAGDLVDYVDLDWSAEPWTGGCYGAHMVPSAWTQLGPELRVPFGRVHWAGTETATKWSGYMDGAISSGRRAAREVLAPT